MPIHDESVSDARTVRAKVTGAPELRTPGGRAPIDPRSIRAHYNIATGEVYGVEVTGERLDDEPTRHRPYRRTLTRRIDDTDTAPEWVRRFVEKHRPAPAAPVSATPVPPADVLARPITPADVAAYPAYFIGGPGLELADATDCAHGYRLSDSCPGCDAGAGEQPTPRVWHQGDAEPPADVTELLTATGNRVVRVPGGWCMPHCHPDGDQRLCSPALASDWEGVTIWDNPLSEVLADSENRAGWSCDDDGDFRPHCKTN